jgi:hypothetical protein
VKKIAALEETLAQEDMTPRIGTRQAKQSGRKRDQASCASKDDSEDADSNFELAQDDCLSSSGNIITEEEQEMPRPAKKKKKLIRQEIDAARANSLEEHHSENAAVRKCSYCFEISITEPRART